LTHLDRVDLKILSLLREDSRASLKEFALAANISIPTARSRIIRLKDLGVIKNLTASVELQPITNIITSFISIKARLPNIKAVVEQLRDIDEVSEVYLTTGQYDIILKLHVPDMQTLDRLVTLQLSSLEGVETAESSFIIETVKDIAGPVLRPNLGFKIECDNCGEIVAETYVMKIIDDREYYFCREPCFLAFSRKSTT
jgi:DNA-binding Lrp family transcriptional regulator